MDAWIDTYHGGAALTRQGTYVLLTDSAVGAQEEDNLRHLVTNPGRDVAARSDRPLPDVQALARLLLFVRGAGAPSTSFPASSCLGGDDKVAAASRGRRTRLAAAQPLRQRVSDARTRRMGEPATP